MSCRFLPDDDEGFRLYLCGIARRVASSFKRKRRRSFKSDGVEAALVLERATSPGAARNGRALPWLIRTVLGQSLHMIAGEEGLPHKYVWDAVDSTRRQLHRSIFQITGIMFVVLLAWGFFRDARTARRDVADRSPKVNLAEPASRPAPQPDKTVTPPGPAPLSVPRPEDAGSIRKAALDQRGRCERGGKEGE